MIFLLIFGLIGLFAPGWLMACCGMDLRTEEEPCLVWFFRILGGGLVAIALWFLVVRGLFHGPSGH